MTASVTGTGAPDAAPAGERNGTGSSVGPVDEPSVGVPPTRARRRADLAWALAAYLALAVVVWWGVWSTHPTSVTTCGCGDSALFLWFLDWPAVALAHGHNPFFSTAMFHPTGVNLLANTSETALGLALAPVTWLFGPVATLNVSLTLAPALSAWAMYWLVRRWVAWRPAAFAAGLLYGFSPFVLVSLADAHLMTGFLVVPPLVTGVLDELLVRQRTSAVRAGVALGLLVTLQFFLGTEVLVIMAMSAAVGIGLVVVYAAVGHRDELARRWRHAAAGLGTGAAVSAALLAWPAWFALAGPAHLGDPVWPKGYLPFGGIRLAGLVTPSHSSASFVSILHATGGYQGPALPGGTYLGAGIVAVIALGLVVWRRDRRRWFFAATGAVTVVLALGDVRGRWSPWRLFGWLPVLNNIIPSRFMAVGLLCAAASAALVADRVHAWAGSGGRTRPALARWPRATATSVLLVALVPMAAIMAGNVPETVVPVAVPRWFQGHGARLAPGSVVLSFPVPFALKQSPMVWQAVEGMPYAMAGGGGPEGSPAYAGRAEPGLQVLSTLSLDIGTSPVPADKQVGVVRAALDEWGVTTVAVPDPAGLPRYEQVANLDQVVAFMTAATGEAPVDQEGTWVWNGVSHAPPALAITPDALARCGGSGLTEDRPPTSVAACVLATGSTPAP